MRIIYIPSGKELTHEDANYSKTEGKDTYERTAPAGKFPANDLELYDMAGNVQEWVGDWYQEDYYSTEEAANDPKRPSTGVWRVLHGGSWIDNPGNLRASGRFAIVPEVRSSAIGFRCARDVSP